MEKLCEKLSTPNDSVVCRTAFGSSNLKKVKITLLFSHILVFRMFFKFTEVCTVSMDDAQEPEDPSAGLKCIQVD